MRENVTNGAYASIVCGLNATQIYTTAYPISIQSMSDKEMHSHVILEMAYFWYDPAIDSDDTLDMYKSVIYVPGIRIPSALGEAAIVDPLQVGYFSPDLKPMAVNYFLSGAHTNLQSTITIKVKSTNRIFDKWDLSKFPFDSRKIQLLICDSTKYSWNTATVPFMLSEEPTNGNTMTDKERVKWFYNSEVSDKIPGSWESNGGIVVGSDFFAGPTGVHPMPCLDLSISISRKAYYVLISKLCSLWLCEVAAFVSFYVPISVAMPRFAAGIISFLTAATIQRTIQSGLPDSADLCFLMVYVTHQMYILMGCCVHTLRMFHKNKEIGEAVVKQKDKMAAIIFIMFFSTSWLSSWLISDETTAGVGGGFTIIVIVHIMAALVMHNADTIEPRLSSFPRAIFPCGKELVHPEPVGLPPGNTEPAQQEAPPGGQPPDQTLLNAAPKQSANAYLPPIIR